MTVDYCISPGTPIALSEWDTLPQDTSLRKKSSRKKLAEMRPQLNEQQELLVANSARSLLIILQGMDTSGKDGVIKNVVRAFNPQGCEITSFKAPTSKELAHDFLWRVHRVAPPRGKVGIFNRSHYEDVLVVRVEELVPPEVWQTRFEAINAFEKLLADNGTVIVKFYLHISHEEQHERLSKRLSDPTSHWKFHGSDLKARSKWDEYVAAYEDVLTRCNTPHAPWYIIPADKKWYRNLIVSRILEQRLSELEMTWPPLDAVWQGIEIE